MTYFDHWKELLSGLDIILSDLDGTIITSYMDNPDKHFHTWQIIRPVVEFLNYAREAQCKRISIVTNQGGVGWGLTTIDDVEMKLGRVASILHYQDCAIYDGTAVHKVKRHGGSGELNVHVAYEKAGGRRKPAPTMIQEAIEAYGVPATKVLYIGDRPEDQAAAEAADVRYVDVTKLPLLP